MPRASSPAAPEEVLPAGGGVALVDLLDRVLERGVLLQADVVVCLAGVPLVGINLRAALAGMDTMTGYGLLRAWDRRIREHGAAGRD